MDTVNAVWKVVDSLICWKIKSVHNFKNFGGSYSPEDLHCNLTSVFRSFRKCSDSNKKLLTAMCCSRKYPYPSHTRFFSLNPPPPLEIPLRNWAFFGISVNLPYAWGGYEYFMELHITKWQLATFCYCHCIF